MGLVRGRGTIETLGDDARFGCIETIRQGNHLTDRLGADAVPGGSYRMAPGDFVADGRTDGLDDAQGAGVASHGGRAGRRSRRSSA